MIETNLIFQEDSLIIFMDEVVCDAGYKYDVRILTML